MTPACSTLSSIQFDTGRADTPLTPSALLPKSLFPVFIFSLLGMQVFGGRFVMLEDGVPRHNFDTLVWAAVTVFQILTGEDWNQVMYDGVRATSMWSTLYFVALIVIGDFMILNLFIAILLSNFSNPKGDDEPEQGEPASHWQGRDLKASGFLAKVCATARTILASSDCKLHRCRLRNGGRARCHGGWLLAFSRTLTKQYQTSIQCTHKTRHRTEYEQLLAVVAWFVR